MKRFRSSLFSALIAAVILFSFMSSSAFALDVDDIESIQAYTKPNFYGQRLYKVEITFNEGSDMTDAASKTYTIWDRAFQNGDFEKCSSELIEVSVNGYTVTLDFDQGPAENKPFGMLCTASWAILKEFDNNGNVTGYNISTSEGYFTRKELDLILDIGDTPNMDNGVKLTDSYGNFNENSVWKKTINEVYDDYEVTFVDGVSDGYYTAYNGKVPVYYQIPESYNAETGMPLVLYVTGAGTSYWEATDANGYLQANNFGTNITYDNATAAWLALDKVIVVSPHVRSSGNKSAAEEVARVIELFKEKYNITKVILVGNSNGTGICSQTMRDFPELVDAFVNNNGWIGDGPNSTIIADTWSEDQLKAIAEKGIAIWVIQGEQDTSANPLQGLTSYKALISYYEDAGWSSDWIADNLRISAFKHYKFAEWGVSDHSCVKLSTWYYLTEPYLDVYENEDPLGVGEVYYMSDAAAEEVRTFEYVTYAESISEWALGGQDAVTRSGGGCNAGYGTVALLALAALPLIRRKTK